MNRAITIRGKGGFVPMCIARGVMNRGLNRFTPAHAFEKRTNGGGGWRSLSRVVGWWVW